LYAVNAELLEAGTSRQDLVSQKATRYVGDACCCYKVVAETGDSSAKKEGERPPLEADTK
jgi:hypothetical protein